jgi:hypothetical protein
LRRDYLAEERWALECGDFGYGRPTAKLRSERADLARPTLYFDVASAELVGAARESPGFKIDLEAWEPDDRGVRWPTAVRLPMGRLDGLRSEPARDCAGGACFSPRARATVAAAPSGVSALETKIVDRKWILVRIEVDGAPVWAELDSGSTGFAVDPASPLGVALGAGDLAWVGAAREVAIGGMVLRDVPVRATPAGSLHAVGGVKPQILVGGPLFKQAGVRVDYEKGEVAIAGAARDLKSERAVAWPIALYDDFIVAEAVIERSRGLVVVDTGSPNVLSLYHAWANARGLPGDRAVDTTRQRFNLDNTDDMKGWKVVLDAIAFGPIAVRDQPVWIQESRFDVAGVAGNGAFSRCKALVFDLASRNVWLEPPCR